MKGRERLTLAGLAAGTLAVLAGYGSAPVHDLATASSGAPDWQLVAVQAATTSIDTQAIAPLFGGSASTIDATASSSEAASGYVILAVAADDDGRLFVLIRTSTDTTVRLFVDDALPDGARITDIQRTHISVTGPADAPLRRISLY